MISPVAPAAAQPILARLTIRMEDEARRLGIPAMVVVIVHKQRVLFRDASGIANLKRGVSVTIDTIFRVGSVTKPFTVLMLMQLCDSGRLQLDDPVARYLQLPDRWQSITFRQLAAHTSGLPREAPLDYFDTMAFPNGEELIATLPAVTPIAEPGAQYTYSNLGYAVLARALEEAGGQPYKDYVHEHIFLPLGMESSGLDLTAGHRSLAAVGYTPVDPPQPAGDLNLDIGGFAAAGQMYSSAADMRRLLAWWFDEKDQARVLSAARRHEMLQPSFASNTGRRQPALGWEVEQVDGSTVARQNGRTFGYGAGVSFIPEAKIGAITLTNSGADPGPLLDLCREAIVQLLPFLAGGQS